MAEASQKRTVIAAALATALAVPAEGLRQFAYYDPPGILTVCYGHTGADVVAKREYTIGECKLLLNKDMARAVELVEQCAPGLPTPVLAAFSDATYNMGPTIACDRNHSTAARMLYLGDLAGACNQLPRWDKAKIGGVAVSLPGLSKRRIAERDLCLTGAK